MNTLRTGVFLLFGLLVPVSCSEPFFNDLVICYFLDAFLMVYCITITGFFFRAKFANLPAEAVKMPQDTNGIYQELERPMDADPYQVLEPSKRKKKAKKKRKTESTQPGAMEMDVFESMVGTSTAPSRRPQ
ncbi:T-cell surface glycoprotein CD3 zeta chain-like [Scomber scombrus]|uniref:T-cell surface glycoprotein CD3 zeta chain-like n=1 Tax=Scomber scombrus TaxID=13677 RepID=A0AAV1NI40_SCOSC|nr:T-cell surface glycoprotein CD3 zeta chain-like [Scomber scombrus]